MTTAQILCDARTLMLLDHRQGCPDRAFYVELAGLLGEAETTWAREASRVGADVVTGLVRWALNVANAYLDLTATHHTNHAHIGGAT
jgi:hypothetical protein